VNIWFSAVVRGDMAAIVLGKNVYLQDGVIVHCDFDVPQIIESGVVAGHAAILHGQRIGKNTLVGIDAQVLLGCDIGEECLIAAGAVLAPNTIVPARSVVMGLPGKVVRQATNEDVERTRLIYLRYRELAARYSAGIIR
jgi:carbonic anhydrase/acetyltransferase-like protein (isoleucine patch superfamily)